MEPFFYANGLDKRLFVRVLPFGHGWIAGRRLSAWRFR